MPVMVVEAHRAAPGRVAMERARPGLCQDDRNSPQCRERAPRLPGNLRGARASSRACAPRRPSLAAIPCARTPGGPAAVPHPGPGRAPGGLDPPPGHGDPPDRLGQQPRIRRKRHSPGPPSYPRAGHPDRATMLSNLGGALQARFERTGDVADLDAAVDAGRQAVRPPRPATRPAIPTAPRCCLTSAALCRPGLSEPGTWLTWTLRSTLAGRRWRPPGRPPGRPSRPRHDAV